MANTSCSLPCLCLQGPKWRAQKNTKSSLRTLGPLKCGALLPACVGWQFGSLAAGHATVSARKNTFCERVWGPNLGSHFGPTFGPCNKDCIKRHQKGDPKADPKSGPRNAIILISKTLHSKRCPSSFWPTARRTRLDPHSWGPKVRSRVLGVFKALNVDPGSIPRTCVTANPSPHKILNLQSRPWSHYPFLRILINAE